MTPPLVPPDTVIPRLPWVPVYADRLWESNFFAVASDAEFKAAFCLWLKSWTQTPPGSLPTDDRILCRLAQLGTDLDKWKSVKRVALRHWIRCDDGRLYHPVIADLVIDASIKLNANRQRTEAARASRWKPSNSPDSNNLSHRNSNRHDLKRTGSPPLYPPHDGGGEQGFSKNGLKRGPAPIDPKILHHTEPCHCDNCTRWAALHARTA